ncbi:MAG: ABC transporter ATP-binding protein [Planctomycetota bacterium]
MSEKGEVLIEAQGVGKKFCRDLKRSLFYGLKDLGSEITGRTGPKDTLRKKEFWAVDDVSFQVRRGECLGLIGHNGAGKSTLLKMLNGLVKPDRGRITMRGRIGALIELGAGFNPILTGRENVYVNASVLGMSRREIDAKFDAILDFAEIGDFIDAPVQSYSSGMKVRLGFAIAAQLEPDILLIDEVLAVGDIGFRARCYTALARQLPRTAIVFVSHNMADLMRVCNHAMHLKRGVGTLTPTVEDAIARYSAELGAANPNRVVSKVGIGDVSASLMSDTPDRGGTGGNGSLELTVSCEIKSDRDYETIQMRFNIAAPNQQILAQVRGGVNPLRRGTSRLNAIMSMPRLTPGVYRLTAIIEDVSGREMVGWYQDAASFVIDGDQWSAGLVGIDAVWEMTPTR